MRYLVASALVLLPVLAHAQASTSTAAKAPALQAKVVAPAPLAAAAAAAKSPAPAAALSADDLMVPVNETVVDAGEPLVAESNASPRLLHSTPISLSLADMRAQADDATVVVHAVVGTDGVPTNLSIARSGGAALDRRALQAVAQYRFQAAIENGRAVEAPVDIKIRVKKS